MKVRGQVSPGVCVSEGVRMLREVGMAEQTLYLTSSAMA